MTFHDAAESSLFQVFEGFMDFLSYLTLKKTDTPEGAVLVLNSEPPFPSFRMIASVISGYISTTTRPEQRQPMGLCSKLVGPASRACEATT